MKLAHNVKLTVFIREDEDAVAIADNFFELVPLDFDKEKLELKKSVASSFEEKKILVFELNLTKPSHVSKFLKHLMSNLSTDEKVFLLETAESRLDPELNFFIRLDKYKLLKDNKYIVTDSGNCFHIKIQIAAYPAKREKGLEVVHSLLSS